MAMRLQRQLIEIATRDLYSEQFDYDAIVQKLSKGRGGIHLLRAYIAIENAARLENPLEDSDVSTAHSVFEVATKFSDHHIFEDLLDSRQEISKHCWARRHIAILKGMLAHKRNPESLEGTLYSLRHDNKGPVPFKQRAQFERICGELAEASRLVEEAELEAWKDQDIEEYHRYKNELETQALSDEIDANEDEETDAEILEAICMQELRFSELLKRINPNA